MDERLVHALLYIRVSRAEHQREGLSLDFLRQATRNYVASQKGATAWRRAAPPKQRQSPYERRIDIVARVVALRSGR